MGLGFRVYQTVGQNLFVSKTSRKPLSPEAPLPPCVPQSYWLFSLGLNNRDPSLISVYKSSKQEKVFDY